MHISLTKQRKTWWAISGLALVLSVIAMGVSWVQFQAPLKPGLDFVGGTRLQIERDCSDPQACAQPIPLEEVRSVLSSRNLGNSSVQLVGQTGQTLSIRTPPLDEAARTPLLEELRGKIGAFDEAKTQIDTVGPTLGKELLNSGLLALLVSSLGIALYLTVRFEFDYALWAIAALLHDVTITLGLFAILGLTLGVEVDSLFIVAVLTIIGFSVNDTVVIYDRVRENLKAHSDGAVAEIVETSVNQTLARSINTSLTTTLPLIAIFLFGGATLKYFALALIVGFISGSYSSIFVASSVFAWWREQSS
ncbi:protein translocase subunit SecF [Lyngbya confervoides]|uniref:Protein-export membrane protein SecF n=1 Tax=Lyngbya confervoides BDU141951 TaxID=1574623 RepID=A0ABD4SYN6_9CYAN|nr:protein translocase subunit SecF [Lyngbya confervoides]MCM1981468.1 protein translocase subunit SecF [Lyngbya confervoides BDU141951]